jgi:hypothetical protein
MHSVFWSLALPIGVMALGFITARFAQGCRRLVSSFTVIRVRFSRPRVYRVLTPASFR